MSVVSGVNAAAVTPRGADGMLDESALSSYIDFLCTHQVAGIALNGATGEYPLTSADELRRILAVAKEAAAGRSKIICGVGGAGLKDTLERCAIAADAGAYALLLPLPFFFPYQQEDVVAFAGAVAVEVDLPILLYNLPQFTSGYSTATVMSLLDGHRNIAGIKDSSGKLETLRKMTTSAEGSTRIVGNDSVLAQALRERICDGVISGVAGVVPELISDLFNAAPEHFDEAAQTVSEFISHIEPFPTPWGLKFIGETRGLFPATFGQPLASSRKEAGKALQDWFAAWWPK